MVDNYFKIANYISLLLMYYNNSDRTELKEYASGHFGNTPNINYIQAVLNKFYKDNNLSHQEIIGTGHSGLSLITNLYLNETLFKYYNKYKLNKEGLNELIKDFGKVIRSEINPMYPKTIYDGGELGYSLSNAYGYAMNSNKDYVTCIIGDGESETGTLTSSLFLNRILNTKSKVLPIINLNGFKMGSESILSMMNKDELLKYYSSLGFYPIYVDYEKDSLYDALNKTINIDKPLIIFKSPKGWTGIKNNIIEIEGNLISHKDPLNGNKNKEIILKEWLDSYNVTLFDDLFYQTIKICDNKEYTYTNVVDMIFDEEFYGLKNNMEALDKFITKHNIQIFSPDEIKSNKLSNNGNVLEMLSETTLNGVYQGYNNNGKALYIGYESFMPIIQSMVSQYLKYIRQNDVYKFRELNGMTYILTSTCWENTYSHQNPEFSDNLLLKNSKYVDVYYPKDGHDLVEVTKKSLNSKNKVNVIVSSKGNIVQYNKEYKDIEIMDDCGDITLIATGDYMLYNINKIKEELCKNNIKVRIVYIAKPSKLLELSKEELNTIFKGKSYYFYHGYPNAIKSLLYDLNINCYVYGFNDLSFESGYYDDHIKNNINNEIVLKKVKENYYGTK